MLEKLQEIYEKILSHRQHLVERYPYFPCTFLGRDTIHWAKYLEAKAEFAQTICEMINGVLKSLTFYINPTTGSICFHLPKGRRIRYSKYSFEDALIPFLEEAGFNTKILSITPATKISRYKARQIKELFDKISREK